MFTKEEVERVNKVLEGYIVPLLDKTELKRLKKIKEKGIDFYNNILETYQDTPTLRSEQENLIRKVYGDYLHNIPVEKCSDGVLKNTSYTLINQTIPNILESYEKSKIIDAYVKFLGVRPELLPEDLESKLEEINNNLEIGVELPYEPEFEKKMIKKGFQVYKMFEELGIKYP